MQLKIRLLAWLLDVETFSSFYPTFGSFFLPFSLFIMLKGNNFLSFFAHTHAHATMLSHIARGLKDITKASMLVIREVTVSSIFFFHSKWHYKKCALLRIHSIRLLARGRATSAMNISKTQVSDDLYTHRIYVSSCKRKVSLFAVPCSRILNEMYTELELSRSHETALDKATLTYRSTDRKVISGCPAERSSLKSDIIPVHNDIDFPHDRNSASVTH